MIKYRDLVKQKLTILSSQDDKIHELQQAISVRDEQLEKMTEALSEQKAKSYQAVATKQVHDKISALETEKAQL